MSIGRDLAELAVSRIVADRPPRILTLDIERLQGEARIKFWDLSDYKNRRIHASSVEEWPRTICAAWRWYGSKKVGFAAEWDGREDMLRTVWDLYHQADIVVGHNLQSFDTKKLRSEWLLMGLTPPAPWKTVDTLKVARSVFGFESNTLASLTDRLGIATKTDHYDPRCAELAVAGDVKAQRRLKAYNRGDIAATEALMAVLLPWMPTFPHVGLWTGDDACCGHCGGELKPSGWARTAVTAYAQYRCAECGAWYRRNDVKVRTKTRPAR